MGVIWINNLSGGMNQRTPLLAEASEADILVNVSQAQIGNWSHRLGTKLYLSSIGASPILGLDMFEKSDGTNYFHAVSAGSLYVNGVGSWTQQEASVWNSASVINMANFAGSHYFASSSTTEPLRYATESGSTAKLTIFSSTADAASGTNTLKIAVPSTPTVSNVFNVGMIGMTITNTTDNSTAIITAYTDQETVTLDTTINDTWDGDTIVMYIKAKYLATNGAYMALSGNDIYPRRAYWTGVDTPTVNVGTDYAYTDSPQTGVGSFGNGRAFVAFTATNYMVFDPQSLYTNIVEGFGCVSHKSISTILGNIIWTNGISIYMLSANSSYPTDISLPIKNDLTGAAIMNNISVGNYTIEASGVKDNRYFLALRSLGAAVKGQTLNSAVLEIDITQNNWKIHTMDTGKLASAMATFTDSNGTNLYAGSYNDGTVYRLEYPATYTDDNKNGSPQAVTAVIRTINYQFTQKDIPGIFKKNVKALHFMYRATLALTIKYNVDGNNTGFTTLTPQLPITSASVDWDWNYISLGKECKTISIEISGTGNFIIYAIGFELDVMDSTGIQGK